MNTILLIDTNYLCHRAYHAMGDLAYGDIGTGAIYGVLRDIVSLQDAFATGRCVFAFDYGGPGCRQALYPSYKATRRARHAEESDEEKQARENFYRQVRYLRTNYLPAAGFRNVFAAEGFEADDIIAAIAAKIPDNDEAVIVGSDHDLWQCLRENVWCWNPQKQRGYDISQFRMQWGLEPADWADVKALAGCATDNIIGIPGVGETTAAKYLRGALNPKTQTYKKIVEAQNTRRRNLPLVQLPFPGTPEFDIVPDEVTEELWQALADRLGMRTIRATVPRAAIRKSRGRKRHGGGFGLR